MSKPINTAGTLLLAALVALGLTTAWGLLLTWTYAMVETSAVQSSPYEQLYVRLDGEPVIMSYGTLSSYGAMQTLTLDRQPHEVSQYENLLQPQYVAAPVPYGPETIGSGGWTTRLAGVSDGRAPATYWYLVHDGHTNGSAYGVGYHSITKTLVGYFGRRGFSTSLPPRDERFQVAGERNLSQATPTVIQNEPLWATEPRLVLLANQRLWLIDVANREVKSLLDCPGAESVGYLWRTVNKLPPADPNRRYVNFSAFARQLVMVRYAERCQIVDPATGTSRDLPLPATLQRSMFSAYELPAGGCVFLAYPGPLHSNQQRVVWIDAAGRVTRETEVTLRTRNIIVSTFGETAWAVALAAPLPPAGAFFALVAPVQRVQIGEFPTYGQALARTLAEAWPALLVLVSVSAALAVAAYRRQAHYSLPGRWLWAGFVFVFGLPGWLAYRLHRTWPVREDCPACGEPAPRDRAACAECGASFPPPPQKGIEVFA